MPGQRLRGRPKAAEPTHVAFPSCFDIEPEVRDAFLAQLRQAHEKGPVVIVSPKAATPAGRQALVTALRSAGVDPAVTAVLGWATAQPKKPEPAALTPVPETTPPAADAAVAGPDTVELEAPAA